MKDQMMPFLEGAFKLDGPTGSASAVMPYYTISYNQDTKYGENVGNGYSKYIITDLLRDTYGYQGVVCIDWGITGDVNNVYEFTGKSWGVELLTIAERHYKVIMAGVDQFGGNNDKEPVLEAYKMGVEEHGEEFMKARFEESALRLLRNIFNTGLFENPYLVPEESVETVGNPEFMTAGYEAQIKSVVMLKNKEKALPVEKSLKVYIPKRFVAGGINWFGQRAEDRWEDPVNPAIAAKYFTLVDSPEEADLALVAINSPEGGSGYDPADASAGGNGYVPIPLQYSKYTANDARDPSLAGGSPFEDFTNRTYKGKTRTATNTTDMTMVRETRQKMGGKPVIVLVDVSNPMVFSEIEGSADAILIHMGVQSQALMDLITGAAEPSGLLPFQMPGDMTTVEKQFEDVPRDMEAYTDSEGNTYDFAFGLNWSGVIDDARVATYK
ncbi:MAG: glycoside hydrolase family 3 C-terminal domain-containing protein [Bacteroidales bacterium]